MLVGCYRDTKHLEWIKGQKLYNIRLGDRNGAVSKSGMIVSASRLLLYNYNNPTEFIVYDLDSSRQIIANNDLMKTKNYPGLQPNREYLLYVVGKELEKHPTYSVEKLREEYAPKLRKGAPFFVNY